MPPPTITNMRTIIPFSTATFSAISFTCCLFYYSQLHFFLKYSVPICLLLNISRYPVFYLGILTPWSLVATEIDDAVESSTKFIAFSNCKFVHIFLFT